VPFYTWSWHLFILSTAALSVLAIFDSLILLFLASFLLAVPVVYDKYDKLRGLARALRVIRVAAICNGIGIFFSFITAYVHVANMVKPH
jgi:hypothetical protein